MPGHATLDARLAAWAGPDPGRASLRRVLVALHAACAGLDGGAPAPAILRDRLRGTGLRTLGCGEAVAVADADGTLAVAVSPLLGDPDQDVAGTLFSVLPDDGGDPFRRPGTDLVAAGCVVHGPRAELLVAWGEGVHGFGPDGQATHAGLRVPPRAGEIGADPAARHAWEPGPRAWLDACLAGTAGPRGRAFRLHPPAPLPAEATRVLTRGGLVLRARAGAGAAATGGARLACEAFAVAYLTEQAGGAATDGRRRILELAPRGLGQRVTLAFGAADEVAALRRHVEGTADAHPLFRERGLFLA